ncbi:hypothetical protein BDQ17DRAFT_1345120 [Cyathus striatus]|nr:hypothetical protein BDQ17DRAFT_1345120 [Cyathus striatus]
MLTDLPSELLLDIASRAFRLKANRIALLLTCSTLHAVTVEILYRNLRLTSRAQLESFLNIYRSQPCNILVPACSIELELTDDRSNDVFTDINSLLSICRSVKGISLDENGRLALDLFNLKCVSYVSGRPDLIQECMNQLNPRCFVWTGTDPPHHFSIAIVSPVAETLFEAFKSFTRLSHLKITHISFPLPLSLPEIPSLKTLYIGQAVFFPVESLTYITAISKAMPWLEEVRLVDVYHETIWGLRVRRSDLEAMSEALVYIPLEGVLPSQSSNDEKIPLVVVAKAAAERIHRIVICEAQTERLIGGDRAGVDTILV